MEHTFELFQFLFILALFAGSALFILRKFKKKQFNRVSEKGLIKIQDAVQLGLSDKIYVVTIGKERVLITMTNNGVDTVKLNDLTDEVKSNFEQMYQETSPKMSDMMNHLRKGFKK